MAKKKRSTVFRERELDVEAASANELTGLMPTLPEDGNEWYNYKDIENLMTDETIRGKDPKDAN